MNLTRRDLFVAGAALPMTAQAAKGKYSPVIACNTYLWVQVFQTPIAYINPRPRNPDQPTAQRDPNQPRPQRPKPRNWTDEQWHTCLSETKNAGFKRVELMSWIVEQKTQEEVRALLDQYGLIFSHVYHGGQMETPEAADRAAEKALQVAEFIRPMSKIVLFDPFGGSGRLMPDDERYRAQTLNKIGGKLKERGMELILHNHNTPMREEARQWRYALKNTDREVVSYCLDLDWTIQAGTDPMPLLYEAGDKDRLRAIHMRTQHNLIWDQTMEDGGDVNFYKVAEYLRKIKFNGILVEETELMAETKVTRSVAENKKLGRIWCEKVYGVSAA